MKAIFLAVCATGLSVPCGEFRFFVRNAQLRASPFGAAPRYGVDPLQANFVVKFDLVML
jgi:hypothetical protein